MGQINTTIAPQFGGRLTVEIITASGSWNPPRSGMTVFVEPCGAGQSGGFISPNATGGESGDLGYGVFRNVTGPISIVIGAAGAAPASNVAPVSGGDTTVSYSGTTITGLGGGKGGKRTGKPGSNGYYSSSAGTGIPGSEGIAAQSVILGTPPQRSAGAFYSASGSAVYANGGPSPLAPGGLSGTGAGQPGRLGSGGGVSSNSTTAAGAGGDGFVIIGYYEVPA